MAPDGNAQTLKSILCGKGYWTPEESGRCKLVFHEDGWGELWCGAELSVWVCATTKWEFSRPEQLNQEIQLVDDGTLAEFEMQLTLQRECPSGAQMKNGSLNEEFLAAGAFNMPRTFTIRVSKGTFAAPYHYTYVQLLKEQGLLDIPEEEAEELKRIDLECTKYSLKLVFDQSPWPQREYWAVEKRGLPESIHFWDDVEFVNPEWSGAKGAMF